MTTSLSILDNIRIASPCSAKWETMTGDDRSRFCDSCHKHVYNIAAMPAQDAIALIQEREGNLCARLFRRADGTVLTSDCPIGARAVWRSTRKLVAAMSLAAMIGLGGVLLPNLVHGSSVKSEEHPFVRRATILWDDVLMWMGFRSPSAVAGAVVCPVPQIGVGQPPDESIDPSEPTDL